MNSNKNWVLIVFVSTFILALFNRVGLFVAIQRAFIMGVSTLVFISILKYTINRFLPELNSLWDNKKDLVDFERDLGSNLSLIVGEEGVSIELEGGDATTFSEEDIKSGGSATTLNSNATPKEDDLDILSPYMTTDDAFSHDEDAESSFSASPLTSVAASSGKSYATEKNDNLGEASVDNFYVASNSDGSLASRLREEVGSQDAAKAVRQVLNEDNE